MVRLTLTKLVILLIIVLTFMVVWKIVFPTKPIFKHTCNMTDDYLFKLEELIQKVYNILESASITNILCYGTLWGQIRISKILSWSTTGEICIFDEELSKLDEGYFIEIFIRNGLRIKYEKIEGYYTIASEPSVKAHEPTVELIIFRKDGAQNMYKRVGLLRKMLPPSCDWTPSLDCFPTYLIQKPLPKKLLGNYYYPVAMGGIELQKYHYSENWWKEVRLKNCNLN